LPCLGELSSQITSQLVKNDAHRTWGHESTKVINKELTDVWEVPTPDPYRPELLAAALKLLRAGKSLGLDFVFLEFILNARSTLKSWFCDFLSIFVHQLKMPKIWRRALDVAIPKPEKPLVEQKSYCPISLLYVPFKILESLIYAWVEPIIDPLLPLEQVGFRHRRSTTDQVTLLTQDNEDNFSAKKAGAVLVDLTAAYDTMPSWLTCKLLQLLPDSHMVCMIMEIVAVTASPTEMANGAGYDASTL